MPVSSRCPVPIPLPAALEETLAKKYSRSCIVLTDELFFRSGVARVLEVVQRGREWVKNIQQHSKVALSASVYFAQLESSRCLPHLEAVGVDLQQTQMKALRAKTDAHERQPPAVSYRRVNHLRKSESSAVPLESGGHA